jgi:hypothetical protein
VKVLLYFYICGLVATAAWDIYTRVDYYMEKGVKDPFGVDDAIGWFLWPLVWLLAGAIYAVRGIDNLPVWLIDWRKREDED